MRGSEKVTKRHGYHDAFGKFMVSHHNANLCPTLLTVC